MFYRRILALGLVIFGLQGILHAQDPGPSGPTTYSILYGGSVIAWPDFTNGTGVVNQGVGAVTSGTSFSVSPTSTTVYTLTVTDLAGDTTSSQVTVNVSPVVVAAVVPAVKTISAGYSYTFASSVSGAVDPTMLWLVDGILGGNSTVGTITMGGAYTAPSTMGSHTITVESNANPAVSMSAAVTVVLPPSISGPLTATPNAISYGGTAVLTATYANGTASLVGGASNVTPSSSPISWTTPALTATTPYTLTVTNAAGDSVTSQATVTVSAVTMSALSPATKYVGVTKTAAITGGVVSGAANTGVVWQVNGVTGGNATYGTIDVSGNYTAPATLPGNPVVTITCVSSENVAITQTMTITLVNLPQIQSFTVQ